MDTHPQPSHLEGKAGGKLSHQENRLLNYLM
jgi:hypothetical protein